jgi:hypothetical protein
MSYQCIACGNTYESKRGLNNHWRVCDKWKNFDGAAKYKRRRLEKDNLHASLGHNLQVQSENPAQLNALPSEVRK